jgi:hypothetical protein
VAGTAGSTSWRGTGVAGTGVGGRGDGDGGTGIAVAARVAVGIGVAVEGGSATLYSSPNRATPRLETSVLAGVFASERVVAVSGDAGWAINRATTSSPSSRTSGTA